MVADGATCNKLFIKNPCGYWIIGKYWRALKSDFGRLSFRQLLNEYASFEAFLLPAYHKTYQQVAVCIDCLISSCITNFLKDPVGDDHHP